MAPPATEGPTSPPARRVVVVWPALVETLIAIVRATPTPLPLPPERP